MFSSNQVLVVSSPLSNRDEIKNALTFALKLSGDWECFTRSESPSTCTYQITEDERVCIGWGANPVPEGWIAFDFGFDIDKISAFIEERVSNQVNLKNTWAVHYAKGFLMEVIPESLASEVNGIKRPFYGIVCFSPYTMEYSK